MHLLFSVHTAILLLFVTSCLPGNHFLVPVSGNLSFNHGNQSRGNAYFALCAALKENPKDVREWVDYHRALGVGKFYLMVTDDPEVNLLESNLTDHIIDGAVELFSLPHVNPKTINLLQVKLYDACLQSVRNLHQFIGFWDIDEFLVPITISPSSVLEYLRKYETEGALGVSWRVVGPSGHVRKPHGGVLRNYNVCTPWNYPDNSEIKSIVNANYALRPTSDPHTFVYAQGKTAVDTVGQAILEGSRHPFIAKRWIEEGRPPALALYHFVTKSEEEYQIKMKRGSAMGNRKDMSYFKRIMSAATEPCEEAFNACTHLRSKWCV